MEEFKPKRKNTAQPAQNGQSAPHTRKPRTPKPQGENAANAQHKPRRPRPAPPATAEQNAAAQSIPAPRPRRPRQNQNSAAPQNGQAAAPHPQGQRRGHRPKSPEHLEMTTPAIPMHICPLGGLGEVGKNITLYECQGDMILVDCGLVFPDADMFGVDLVIPDFTYVLENRDRIKGLFITHGHEDHIGSLPYLLKKFNWSYQEQARGTRPCVQRDLP